MSTDVKFSQSFLDEIDYSRLNAIDIEFQLVFLAQINRLSKLF